MISAADLVAPLAWKRLFIGLSAASSGAGVTVGGLRNADTCRRGLLLHLFLVDKSFGGRGM